MSTHNFMRDIDDFLASRRVPEESEGCVVVLTHGLYVWIPPNEVRPDEQVCFYDGDYRQVLLRSDPRVQEIRR